MRRSFEQEDASLDVGGRLLPVIVRPYPAKVAGIPVSFDYESGTGSFTFQFASRAIASSNQAGPAINSSENGSARQHITEFFVPLSLARGRRIVVDKMGRGGDFTYDEALQTLFIRTNNQVPDTIHTVSVSFDPPLKKRTAGTGSFSILTILTLLAAWFIYRLYPLKY